MNRRSTASMSQGRVQPDAKLVADHLERLVRRFLPSDTPEYEARVSTLTAYSLRIAGSRISASVASDEYQVSEQIKKSLVKNGRTEDALKFAEVFQKLIGKRTLQNRYAVLYVLQTIAQEKIQVTQSFESSFASMGLPQVETASSSQVQQAKAAALNAGTVDSVIHQPATTLASSDKVAKWKEQFKGAIENTSSEVPEDHLLHHVIFAMQGIDSKYIKFDPRTDAYTVQSQAGVPRSSRDLIQKICELGWLFRRVKQALGRWKKEKSAGLVAQSFTSALESELNDYYRLIAVLEAQLDAKPVQLTMKRLLVWTEEPLYRMKLMAMLVDSADGLKGGALASAIHAYRQHGDEFVRKFVSQIMKRLSKPLFQMIEKWVFEGELEDPFLEFFVVSDPNVSDENLWQDKYRLNTEMIPAFISDSLAKKILVAGKSIIFIRRCCNDTKWVMESNTASSLDYQDSGVFFESVIAEASQQMNKRLIEIVYDKYMLREHCLAIKRYLLLAQGDFVQYLMNLLHTKLDKPASSIYLHNLTDILETAIRSSNAQYDDSDVLNRLDVELTQGAQSDCGWDIFSLKYKVDTPLSTIMPKKTMKDYMRIFNFLWRLKRVEFSLCNTWRRQVLGDNRFRSVGALRRNIHEAHLLRNEMLHFIYNLQYFITFEVLETSWEELLKDFTDASDLDAVIASHRKYIDNVLDKALLSSRWERIHGQMNRLFELIIRFRHVMDNLYDSVAAEIARQTAKESKLKELELRGKWGLTEADEEVDDEITIKAKTSSVALVAQISTVSREYKEGFQAFMDLLKKGSARNENLRYLEKRIDFNEFFAIRSGEEPSASF